MPDSKQAGAPAVPKRSYVRRLEAARGWIKDYRGPITISNMAESLGWPTGAAAKALRELEKRGEVWKVKQGMYGLSVKPVDRTPQPKAPIAPADPYAVVDAVLTELFPGGVKIAHLQQIIEWREATRALLELMEAK